MSRENVTKFFEAIRADEGMVERLRALEGDVDAFARLSVELGRERGFAFEPSEVRETLDALARKGAAELSDKDLSAVSGGMGSYNTTLCMAGGGGGAQSTGCTGMLLGSPGAFFGRR